MNGQRGATRAARYKVSMMRMALLAVAAVALVIGAEIALARRATPAIETLTQGAIVNKGLIQGLISKGPRWIKSGIAPIVPWRWTRMTDRPFVDDWLDLPTLEGDALSNKLAEKTISQCAEKLEMIPVQVPGSQILSYDSLPKAVQNNLHITFAPFGLRAIWSDCRCIPTRKPTRM